MSLELDRDQAFLEGICRLADEAAAPNAADVDHHARFPIEAVDAMRGRARSRRSRLPRSAGVGFRAHLERAGVGVTASAGDGWEAMDFHPERPEPPEDVFARVTSWLAQTPDPVAAPRARAPRAAREIVLEVGDLRVRESSLTVQRPEGRLVGVLAEPVDPPDTGLCAIPQRRDCAKDRPEPHLVGSGPALGRAWRADTADRSRGHR